MNASDRHTVLITWNSGGLGTGRSVNRTSALVRPFRILLDEGRSIGRINYLFYQSDKTRVLGALCFTTPKRLLFFPGIAKRNPRWITEGATLRTIGQANELIDHLTLESDFNSWHVTMLGLDNSRRSVLRRYRTKEILEGVTYWFGLSILSDNILEECPNEIRMVFSSSSKDADRRIKIVKSSGENSVNHVFPLYTDASVTGSSFIHFDFIVDRRHRNCFSNYSSKQRTLFDSVPPATTAPTGPPALRSPVPVPIQLPVRSHPVPIPGFQGTIWVTMSMRAGELVQQAVIGSL